MSYFSKYLCLTKHSVLLKYLISWQAFQRHLHLLQKKRLFGRCKFSVKDVLSHFIKISNDNLTSSKNGRNASLIHWMLKIAFLKNFEFPVLKVTVKKNLKKLRGGRGYFMEGYSEPCQTFKMERFAKIFEG